MRKKPLPKVLQLAESPPMAEKKYTEYPNQELLKKGLSFIGSAEIRKKLSAHAEAVAAKFDEIMTTYELDVIIAPGDCMLSEYAAVGGQ